MKRKSESYRTGEHALTEKEYQKLLEVCSSLEDELLIKLAVSLGLRRADITSIEIQNLDLDNNSLTYHERKKGNRVRTVAMGPKLKQVLTKYLKTVPRNQKFLFRFTDRTAYNHLQVLCALAEIPPRPFHALRATCIKRCQAKGWAPEQVAELTGDTIRVIQEHYATPSRTEMHEVAQTKEVI